MIAVIPARGGSKRLPKKNILPFAGSPLICHSIRLARSLPIIDRVCVSTDDAETARIAREAGAEIVIRPPELAERVIYVSRASMVIDGEELFGSHIAPLVIDPLCALGDIDTLLDFQVAEFLFTKYGSRFAPPRDLSAKGAA